MWKRGQALVEFALVLPLLMFLLLGLAELAYLFGFREGMQRGADVLADVAAQHIASEGPDWRARWEPVLRDEQRLARCDADPSVTFPDGTFTTGDRVRVTWTCRHDPQVIPGWGGLDVSVVGESVIASPNRPTSSSGTDRSGASPSPSGAAGDAGPRTSSLATATTPTPTTHVRSTDGRSPSLSRSTWTTLPSRRASLTRRLSAFGSWSRRTAA